MRRVASTRYSICSYVACDTSDALGTSTDESRHFKLPSAPMRIGRDMAVSRSRGRIAMKRSGESNRRQWINISAASVRFGSRGNLRRVGRMGSKNLRGRCGA